MCVCVCVREREREVESSDEIHNYRGRNSLRDHISWENMQEKIKGRKVITLVSF